MNIFIKTSLVLVSFASLLTASVVAQSETTQQNYAPSPSAIQPIPPQPKGILPSLDFVKRFGKHCTSYKDMLGRNNFGLCDDINLCQPEQYKACYTNCIQKRKKEDEKTLLILKNLARCTVDKTDKQSVEIDKQVKLRLQKQHHFPVKTFEMPSDHYVPEKGKGVRSLKKSFSPFAVHCTSHKNRLGIMVKGVCDDGKQCNRTNYKKCYKECITGRPTDEKTPYILKKLLDCRVNLNDLELGSIAKSVHDQYRQYEITHLPEKFQRRFQ